MKSILPKPREVMMCARYGNAPRCGKCGGRLFRDYEGVGTGSRLVWECSIGCGARYTTTSRDPFVCILPTPQLRVEVAGGLLARSYNR